MAFAAEVDTNNALSSLRNAAGHSISKTTRSFVQRRKGTASDFTFPQDRLYLAGIGFMDEREPE